MPKKAPFKIGYSDDAVGDLKWFGKLKGPEIVRQIGKKLSREADVKTKNRKPVNPPILDSAWELRCGQNNSVRVFYDVDARDREVTIQRVGYRDKSHKLFIRDEPIDDGREQTGKEV